MSTYKILVEFTRDEDDDVEVVKDKYGDAPVYDKLATQLAVELQAAYLLPGCELDGHFEVLSVGGVEINEKGRALVSKEAKEASEAPETLDDLMKYRLHKIGPHCTVGEDNDGQIVIYTNLREVAGELIDMDELENEEWPRDEKRKLTGIVTEVNSEKIGHVIVGLRDYQWITAGERHRVVGVNDLGDYETGTGVTISPACFDAEIVRWEVNE